MESPAHSAAPTPLQQASVARSLLSPKGGHYIQQLVCEWTEPLNLKLWRHAWELVAARHDSLRAYFAWEQQTEILQKFADAVAVLLEPGNITPADRQAVLADFLRADRRRGFDLSTAPLWRLTAFRWNEQETTTVWTFHHALLDGRSHALIWQEADRLYRDLLIGKPPDFPPAKSFREFLSWLAEHPESTAAAYWRDRLQNFHAPTDLPTLSAAPDAGDNDDDSATEEVLSLSSEITDRLQQAAERHAVTLNNLVQAAWALLLARYQAVEEIVFGTVRSCRHWTDDAPNGRIGMFINTVPFRVTVAPTQAVGAWLRELRAQQRAVRAGEYASAEQIRRWCDWPRSAVPFRTCVMFENSDACEQLSNATQRVSLIQKTDLPTLAAYGGRRLTLVFNAPLQQHPVEQQRTILRHLEMLLISLASASAETTLEQLTMLTAEDRRLTLNDWQGPATAPAPPLHRVLEAQAAQSPDACAIEFAGQSLSYRELHRQANQLARRLLQFCRSGDRVAVAMDRALEQPVVWLAALKAGLVYAPVDPANPRERLEFLFRDLEPAVLLTQTTLRSHLPPGSPRVLCLDDPDERATQAALDANPLPDDPPADAATNLLYTSGSTGVSKAAINRRAGLDNFAAELRRTFDFGPADRVLQSSSTSFDASLFDFVAALQSGATLVMVPSEQLHPGPGLTQMLAVQRISVSLLTPTVMRSTAPPPAPALRVLFSAGEPLTLDLLERWSPGRRVFNVCGPTECSVWFNCEESRLDGCRPTIGRLIANCRGYVLDEQRQPVPVCVPGELYLAGAGTGMGYWRREELTAERYLPDPFAPTPDARMYRTGDRVRWWPDGRMEYLGRLDSQVKVHGVRVELGEIETALRRHPGVADAVLVLHQERLLAWFVPREPAPTTAALRAWLADQLPLIFMPAEFRVVPQFPRTITGKTNRKALLNAWLAEQRPPETSATPDLPPEVRQKVIEEWNQTARPYPLERSVLNFFREQVNQQPDATALKSSRQTVTYAELNRRANRVAHDLLQAGLQPEDIVALRFERSIAFVVAALAVLKAGGSFLPLDAHIPAARQDFVLRDSGARFALAAKEFQPALAQWRGWSATVDDDFTSGSPAENDPAVPENPRRRAYVIYTSGSTGQPKGVEIEHRSLTNLVCFYRERLQLTATDRSTLFANPAFDASVADVWPILCAGGTVLIPPPRLLEEPDELIHWLAAESATFSFVPTAIGELLFRRNWPQNLALRFFCVGGEALRSRPPASLPFPVINSYGPTENTVDATWETVLPAADGSRPGIGRPIANVRAYVLNDDLQPVSVGAEGELFLGGAQVARGYLNRPELTAEKFLPDPFVIEPNARMYRTGDRVRWHTAGTLEFLGRTDDQVQVHGQRVELGEIETALRHHPAVRDACCRPLLNREHDPAIGAVSGVVAHVVLAGADGADLAAELRPFLSARLPGYMVPAFFIPHPALPLTAQGKVDRQALDASFRAQNAQGGKVTADSEDSLVRLLSELWQRILPSGANSRPDQTFQELGGDSLGAVRLMLGVEEITGRRLALSTFLMEPTLAGLCRATATAELESQTPVVAWRRTGTKPPLFCLYTLGGDVEAYFDFVAALEPDQPVFGIRSRSLHHVERAADSIESAAREVREALRKFGPKRPFGLVGFSWAGLLAFEVARQYAHEENFNPFCCLLGTIAPPRQTTLADRIADTAARLPGWAWRLACKPHDRWRRFRLVMSLRFLRKLIHNEKLVMPDWAVGAPLAVKLIEQAHRYQPAATRPVPIHLFRERGTFRHEMEQFHFRLTNHLPDGGWSRWANCTPEIHWLDGEHLTVIKPPQVKQTATELTVAWKAFLASRNGKIEIGKQAD